MGSVDPDRRHLARLDLPMKQCARDIELRLETDVKDGALSADPIIPARSSLTLSQVRRRKLRRPSSVQRPWKVRWGQRENMEANVE